ncbi:Uncharacterised protein [Mycobacteroides abscessus subsp. abscessus]|nr:Uncharacterised protein [Mycobacteroides abscessus subsp. abscessus]
MKSYIMVAKKYHKITKMNSIQTHQKIAWKKFLVNLELKTQILIKL